MGKSTAKDLVEVLKERNSDGKYDRIIERASLNGYHDHKFTKVLGHPEYGECVCPKVQLVQDLSNFPELADVANEVMNGIYDEPADAEDVEEMRSWLMADNAPDQMFIEMGMKVPTREERIKASIDKKQSN